MQKFIVSARKYRPQLFDTVVGQSHITTTLKNAIKSNQLAHAFLFCGPRGVGKTTCARILAKTINCENQTKDGEACNTCRSCISFNEGTSLNMHELDAASNNSVEDIRSLVDQVRFAPQAGNYKVYIIDEVHMLSTSAFNAFLKTLEEPPSYAIFILATTEKYKIIPTILSRCQIFDFKRITLKDTVEHLENICSKETIKNEKAALQIIAQKSEGCMRDSLSILDKLVSFSNGELTYANVVEHLNILDTDYYFKLLNCLRTQNLSDTLLLYDDVNSKGFESDILLNGFSEFIRNLLVCQDERAAVLLDVTENFKEQYRQTAKTVSPEFLISSLNILHEAEINYKAARNKRLHVELAFIKLCYLQQAIELSTDTNVVIKKKMIDGIKPVNYREIIPFESNNHKTIELKPTEASLLVETPASNIVNEPPKQNLITKDEKQKGTKLSALANIRRQVKGNGTNGNSSTTQPLNQESLQQAWNEYITQLRKEKDPAATNFEMTELRIQDDNNFIALVTNKIQFRFIEQSGTKVSQFLREKLNNSLLQFFIVMEENKEEKVLGDIPLSARDQYQKIIEEYPLVKELKERLRLDLEY